MARGGVLKIHGTKDADHLKALYGVDRVYAGRGNDDVFLLNALDTTANGGEGKDTFEFRVFADQTYTIERDGDVTVVTIDGADYHQEVTLIDFEKIVVNELDF